ncbi:MAG: response regulator transcription factor [Oscillospiraceae bacterium]|jgi:two-component system alkaline phosphatase synthesis response regulator PhoP|nr:response regulator transcription factor [Oscillospiraceae bacterium]
MIYLLEDEEGIRNIVVYALEQAGLEPFGFAMARDFWAAAREKPPDLVLLDIMLPDEDGLTVLKKLRAASATERTPVMMLTAMGAEYDKVRGLDLGADDYLAKPFGMMELIARVKSLLRRADGGASGGTGQAPPLAGDEYQAGLVKLSLKRRKVWADGTPVPLSFKEFETLAYLMKNKGIALSREQIMDHVWGYDYDGESRTVDVHVRSLRAKLGACEDVIETVRGVGYRISSD